MNRWILPAIALAGAAIGAAAMVGYDRVAAPDGASRTQIEGVVHDYVLAHPEIIPEAMRRLQDRENGSIVAANRTAITEPFGSAWAGNPKGDVTVVEYFDYNCGYCRASLPVVAQLLKDDPNVRLVYRDFPILAPSSRDAAQASLAAAQQGKYRAFHDALYAAGPVSTATIAATAAMTGVDIGDVDSTAIDAELAKNMDTARKLGLTGTPSWVIGDRVLSGAMPIDELNRAIAAAREG
ncbi:DsbA family protein [Sphingomonas oligophenolica]|uniref:DsbA family protein n=1 Tax=Sphingomonas oligophenolica TaxID=301154 RepID=A0A502CGB3_9SPHN|nr:DsbA family protein [Sphingomonas oligophenolica]TPG12028.1 DsbA family protein [Sphingomonas oligophenolica]